MYTTIKAFYVHIEKQVSLIDDALMKLDLKED